MGDSVLGFHASSSSLDTAVSPFVLSNERGASSALPSLSLSLSKELQVNNKEKTFEQKRISVVGTSYKIRS